MGEAHPCFSGILFLWATAHHLKGLKMSENKETMQDVWQEFQKELNTNTATKDATLCGACGEFMETNEEDSQGFHIPEQCSANDEIVIRSLFVECREWFDKVNGNSYFSARVWVNGKWEITLPFQYGYEDHFKSVAVRALVEKGFIPKELENRALWVIANELKFDCYTSKAYTTKKEMFKETN